MSATATAARPSEAPVPPGSSTSLRRKRLLVGLIAGAVVALLALGGWLVLFSPVFAARQVKVVGTEKLTAEQVRAAAQVPLGRPLARQDLTAIASRTTQLPQVSQARVRRDWPHAVEVVIVERKPVLAVAQPGGFVMVDRTGVAYETRTSIPRGVQRADVNPDNTALLVAVGTVSAALPDSLRRKVERIAATNVDDITVRLGSGVVVSWGSSSDSALKAKITEALLTRKPRATIDVSSPHNPAFR